MKPTLSYFHLPMAATAFGVFTIVWFGFATTGSTAGALKFLLIGLTLTLLEISLSFDNAVVNANKLKYMTPLWQRRFLTWGILVAVFGMRIVFPIVIVSVAAGIGPVAATILAATEPETYSHIMHDAHVSVAAFGGTYLMMVALSFFVDTEKNVDWIRFVETRLRACADLRAIEVVFVLCLIIGFTLAQSEGQETEFLFASVLGLLAFLLVEVLGDLLDKSQTNAAIASGGLGAFLYLEVLDASFSFDGVIGAFALTNNMFLIAVGLGIGAFYVRSMTIMLVERDTLSELRFLEHGAFYSVLALAVIMLTQSVVSVPEYVTGPLSIGFIALATFSSVRYAKRPA
ncbi:DUF475 domain-containing protein [uncultured Ruegeria sp.]|uniref:DUF475 domain-containing protein n=1 Tax=uncultured Ruegeria sp. TaxID=259304 RepID=UPI002636ECF4|nr:DUF475 domain-containing protein [uncultured Ruegeria sp.]